MDALKVGWAAPWNIRSAIAQSAAEVAFELAGRGHAVTVLRTEIGEGRAMSPRPAPGSIHHIDDYSPAELRDQFDLVVAHIGDHHGFHGALPKRLRDTVVLGIFHDAMVPDRPTEHLNGDEAGRRRPSLEWLARRTSGAVAHAEHYAQRLRGACPGPVAVLPLAFTVPGLPPPPTPWDHLTIGAVGAPNPARRIDQLIMAIGASPVLRSRCRLKLIGEGSDEDRTALGWLADRARIEPPEFTGWVSETELRWQIRDVDVMSCLRNPVVEGASAALILAQTSGRATLVSNHGCYTEVPADTVMACSPEHEALDAMRHLERVIDDPALRSAIGERARAFAVPRHAPAAYVDRLEPLLFDLVASRPGDLAMRRLTDTLIEFGLPPDDVSVTRAELSLASLIASTPRL